MFQKQTILIASFFLLLAVSFIIVSDQISCNSVFGVFLEDSASHIIAVSPDELLFVGEQGGGPIERTITVVGLAEGSVEVDIVLGELYDNSSGKTASIELIKPLGPISMSVAENATFMLNSSETDVGTFYGEILLTATAGNNVTTTTVNVIANIIGGKPALPITINQMVIIAIVGGLVVLAFVVMQYLDKEILVVTITVAAVLVWFASIISSIFTFDTSDIVTSVLIAVLVTHVFGYVKEKRERKAASVKSATDTQNKGIANDIQLLQNILGETTTHYASFNPGFEGIDETEIAKHPKILFNEQGKLSRDKWEQFRKQGSISDLPLLYLEKYYDFIDLYNRYYSCAITITKDMTSEEFGDLKKNKPHMEEFFGKFNVFRKSYEDLETVLFVYMSYFLGLFVQTELAPIKIPYPRITRVLLKKLIDYKILEPKDYPMPELRRITRWLMRIFPWEGKSREIGDRRALIETRLFDNLSKKFKEKYKNEIERKTEDLKPQTKDKEDLERQIKQWLEGEVRSWMQSSDTKIEKEKLIARIESWDLTAKEVEKILKDIYNEEDMRRFYYMAGQEFRQKYKELLKSVADLPPLAPDCIEREKIPFVLAQHVIQKKLLDELDKLKSLKEKGAITPKQFEVAQDRILEISKSLNKKQQKGWLLEELRHLKMLLDLGALTPVEFDKRKVKIMEALKEIDES